MKPDRFTITTKKLDFMKLNKRFNLLKILPTKSREKKSTMFLEIQILGKGASTNEN